ncbi:MAG: Mov34/MPN/PAD-1 family protein [Brevundimonas sp.]|uniref:Mov34/MPN/PAD-1 family protein n=1 Tax=Brevundimonas sp. TaxID=1871086 RepID=UPI00248A503B|nr:Mov34/MPN/PAD-1 family protein [Brevundimonas sp.]MDI1328146.1 Mov34/MPN/PAD-1 family protein [Brevundimonas sp.]
MRVELPVWIQKRLRGNLREAGRLEIGGVLMGEQLEPGHFRIVDFTVDDQKGGMAHFTRGTDQHRAALDAFFARTDADYGRFNYLGEWHSHPSFPVRPSPTDTTSMLDLVNGERGIDFAVLMIARLDYWVALKRSFTLFVRDRQPVAISEAPR